ncbi:MAG: type II secretion system protein GspH [Gammaproteobacteria bacterium RIFCSPHIGHO2_12_FULL_38_14]|nr:MAG: type II secretion system protein GspH [Gammaproteobacteria bacterium RIFCSPHIGHO2_12_FULL_38_14]
MSLLKKNQSTSGFTLIEILVVLIIIAIITAVAVMAFGHMGRARRERIVAEQLMRAITIGEQQAILTPSILGLGFDPSGYQFFQYEITLNSHAGVWKPLNNSLSNPTAFKNLFIARLTFVSGYSAEIKIHASHPIIIFSPGGKVTPFILNLQGENHIYIITVHNNATSTLLEKKMNHGEK